MLELLLLARDRALASSRSSLGLRARHLLATLAGAGVLLAASSAGASLTWTANYPYRSNRANRVATGTQGATTNAGINRDNCLDTGAVWKLAFSNLPTSGWTELQVWLRDQTGPCSDQVAGTVTTAVCKKVASIPYNTLMFGDRIGLVPDAAIVAAATTGSVTDPNAVDRATVCNPATNMDPVTIYLNFLLVNGTTVYGTPGTGNEYEIQFQTTYDIRGPDAPNFTHLGVGDSLLIAEYDRTSTTTATTKGYQAYCFPIPGQETQGLDAGTTEAATDTGATLDTGAADTGTDSGIDATSDTLTDATDAAHDGDDGAVDTSTDDASGDTSSTTTDAPYTPPSNCPALPADFRPGSLPNPAYACSGLSGGGTVDITGLKNKTTYAVAMAGVDTYDNPGPLSPVLCDFPVPTKDFYGAYRAAGGTAGGGYCAFAPGSSSIFGAAVASLVACTLIARRRRRTPPKRAERGTAESDR